MKGRIFSIIIVLLLITISFTLATDNSGNYNGEEEDSNHFEVRDTKEPEEDTWNVEGVVDFFDEENLFEASQVLCEDDDGGKDYYDKGTTSGEAHEYLAVEGYVEKVDYCDGVGNLVEYYCYQDAVYFEYRAIPGGYFCFDGALMAYPECTDSDGGEEYYLKGTTTGEAHEYLALEGYIGLDDVCAQNGQLHEYYCFEENVYFRAVTPPEGYTCFDGIFFPEVRTSCIDTDGGINPYGEGTTVGYLGGETVNIEDECDEEGRLVESYCLDDQTVTSITLELEMGYECFGGEFIAQGDCEDSDGGRDYYTTGYITGINYMSFLQGSETLLENQSDYCDEGNLIEYFCTGGYVQYTTNSPAFDEECSDGAFVSRFELEEQGGDNIFERLLDDVWILNYIFR
ncbi:hypothetical protein HOD38_00380 [archaeon]|jgi:hypothetical protein|nr:hypothetical protein [archaeon]MBT4441313.1 hypothetical protein [archaeon]